LNAAYLLAAFVLPAFAQHPEPFARADAAAGRALVERDCVECHARQFPNASQIYTREDRRVRSPAQLLAQVQRCNVQLKSGYFPDDEENAAAFLNERYYKFR
jgi:hypothetical protein